MRSPSCRAWPCSFPSPPGRAWASWNSPPCPAPLRPPGDALAATLGEERVHVEEEPGHGGWRGYVTVSAATDF
ncbi:hypothetical protein F0U62_29600 [Cystobacter fuscus]|nr:hypothetical protein F0U62_29600 [Cystobacter fuscus]